MYGVRAAIGCLLLGSCGGNGGGDSGTAARVEAAGSIDAGFGVQGLATFPGRAAATAIVELDDGNLLVGGSGPYLAKLTAAGSPDTTFASGGVDAVRRGTKAFQVVEKIELLSTNRIAVVEGHYSACVGSGFFCQVQSFRDVVARRIDGRGNPDLSYGDSGVAMLPSSQGSLVVSTDGRVTSFTVRAVLAGPAPFGVASLTPAGARDPAFETRAFDALQGCGARFSPPATAITSAAAARSGSGFIVATIWSGGTCVAKLGADGSLDASFASAGYQTFVPAPPPGQSQLFRTLVRADGAIVVVLHYPNAEPIDPPLFLFLTSTGAKDTASAANGIQAQPIILVAVPRDIALQANGKVVATGVNSVRPGVPSFPLDEANPYLTRSTANAGVFDASFGPFRGGYMPLQGPQGALTPAAIALGRDGAIFVAGSSTGTGAILAIR